MENINEITNQESNNNVKVSESITKGLGFHQFDGNVSVNEVMQQIGANFNVKKEHIVRISDEVYDDIINNNGSFTTINTKDLIDSHSVTVREDNNSIIGVVSKDYGIIQNSQALEILDLVTNSSISGKEMKIVSAGLVHNNDPYVQVLLDGGQRINNDNSDTQFYAFFHTSHDGTSSLKVSFSAIRVVCANTFAMNLKESNGFIIKHSKHVDQRMDFTKEYNVKCVQNLVKSINFFVDGYVNKMSSFALTKVTDSDISDYIYKLFLEEKANLLDPQVSTRMQNQMDAFRDVLENGVGQDSNRGTKLWLMNGTTNYFSNVKSYGNKLENEMSRSTKKFDSILNGYASRKMNLAMNLLAV